MTAEEKGLLGAQYYATHPLYPLEQDGRRPSTWTCSTRGGARATSIVVGLGNSTLDDVLRGVLAGDGRTIAPDAEPEKGFYYRSDHFEFAKQGVPALFTGIGIDALGAPAGTGSKRGATTRAPTTTTPSDEVKPGWDFVGAVDDLRALFRLGYLVASTPTMPAWKPGTEFKSRRDSMMARR